MTQGENVGFAWIDLDGVVAITRAGESETRIQTIDQVTHLVKTEKAWRASAPVQLCDVALGIQVLGEQHHFTIQAREVRFYDPAILAGDPVVSTVMAAPAAKGKVDIER